MLNNSSACVGTNLAEIFVEAGITIVPKQLTLINELNSAINNNMFGSPSLDVIPMFLVNASSGDNLDNRGVKNYVQSNHDVIMDTYIADLKQLTSNYVTFARNVVNKKVNSFKENFSQSLSNYNYKEAEDFFKVSYFKLHDIFKTYLLDELKTYKGGNSKYYFESVNLSPIMSEEFDICKYILTGDEDLDKTLIDWFNALSRNKALHFLTENIAEYTLSNDGMLDYTLINYLFYRNLTEKTDLDLGYSSAQLRSKAIANRDYFGYKLGISLDMFNKDIAKGRIFSTTTQTSYSYMNKEPINVVIYEESLGRLSKQSEGEVGIETLFGYLASGNGNSATVDEIIESKEEYFKKWNIVRSMYTIHLNNNRLDIFKQMLRFAFDASLKDEDRTDDEKQFLVNNPKYIEETNVLGSEYINDLHISDIDNVDKIVLDLVAKIQYRFTNAYYILRDMSESLALSENIDPLEAALFATVRYLTDSLVEQLNIIKQ